MPASTPPVVSSYRPQWPAMAAALAADLYARLGPLAARIEHIGSTSIPGMAAKDVLDLQVSTTDLDAAAEAFDAPLHDLGFERTRYERDHVPAGRPDRPEQWAKRLWSRRDHPAGEVNLHVRLCGSPNERLALLFRDWFRAHPAAIAAYAGFKRSLAVMSAGLGDYTDTKDWVVDVVIVAAEEWAAATGWQVPEPLVRRLAGRVLVVDAAARVLLLHGLDPARRSEPYWFTVGGGAKPGESLAEAAARELGEETGITVAAADLGQPIRHEFTEFSFNGRRFLQEQDLYLLRVESAAVSTDGLQDEEAAVVTGHRWWSIAKLESTSETFYPVDLPSLLRDLTT